MFRKKIILALEVLYGVLFQKNQGNIAYIKSHQQCTLKMNKHVLKESACTETFKSEQTLGAVKNTFTVQVESDSKFKQEKSAGKKIFLLIKVKIWRNKNVLMVMTDISWLAWLCITVVRVLRNRIW